MYNDKMIGMRSREIEHMYYNSNLYFPTTLLFFSRHKSETFYIGVIVNFSFFFPSDLSELHTPPFHTFFFTGI